MAYQVLYRRFRPKSFDEIVGQDHIVPVLKNEIKTGKVSHAYLFSGPRGTGKTSAAKVFARAVNCLDPKDGEACGKCAACLAEEGAGMSNIIEIDAASNRGIDEIRQLRENVAFLPTGARYRVYIIDEVHMLTPEAFNALLKTLEEPPEHIIFIFATTEVHRILPTILSRCQRFDFRRVPDEAIVERLKYVLGEVGAPFEEEALKVIADEADGGLRDALSLTDKVLASSDGAVSLENVERVLGLMGQDFIFDICEAVVSSDVPKAFGALANAMDAGTDAEYIIDSVTEYFRSLMIYTNMPEPKEVLFKSREYFDSLKRSAVSVTNELLSAYMSELGRLRADARTITNTRYLIETAVLRMSDRSRLTDYVSLTRRVELLEARLDGIMSGQTPVAAPGPAAPAVSPVTKAPPAGSAPAEAASPAPSLAAEEEPISGSDPDELARLHEAVKFASRYLLNKERDMVVSGVAEDMRVASYSGNTINVYLTGGSRSMRDVFDAMNGTEKMNRILSSHLGRNVTINIVPDPGKGKTQAGTRPRTQPVKEVPDQREVKDFPANGAAAPSQAEPQEPPFVPPGEDDIPPIGGDMPEEDIITDNSSPGSGSIMESAMAILGDLQEVQE